MKIEKAKHTPGQLKARRGNNMKKAQKITFQKESESYYVYLNKGSIYQMAEYFINSGLAINWGERLRSSLKAQGFTVVIEMAAGFLSNK